jgi:serpin B
MTGLTAVGVAQVVNAAGASDVTSIAATQNDFDFRLLHALVSRGTLNNIIVSPLSVSQALTMTYNGAAGSTETAMAQTLGIRAISGDKVNISNQQLLQALRKADPDVRIAIANALWIEKSCTIQPNFLKMNKEFYAADVQNLDFARNPQHAAEKAINAWVNRNTQGKIPSIVGNLDNTTAIVLTDAVYFKGGWSFGPFAVANTRPRIFFLPGGKSVNTPMMEQQRTYVYLETTEFQAIRMPYGNGQFAMYVFLPRKKDGLRELLKSLDESHWTGWTKDFKEYEGTIVMPKFKLSYGTDLKDALSAMGMEVAFDSAHADFSGMGIGCRGNGGSPYISAVEHKTYVKVDEQGTEAAAATADFIELFSSKPKFGQMIVDHPFLFTIAEQETGAILFVGTVTDPTSHN